MNGANGKFVKMIKTKFRKNVDEQEIYHKKSKHHDKAMYRMMKNEKDENYADTR